MIDDLRACIEVGTFLLLKDHHGGDSPTNLCQLMSWQENPNENAQGKEMSVNLFNSFPPQLRTSTRNVSWRHMTTARQTSKVAAITPNDVLDICFVFHKDSVERADFVPPQGRADCYVTDEPLSEADFVAFPCLHPSFPLTISYSRHIWDEMEEIQQLSRQVLNSLRTDQGSFTRKRSLAHVSLDTWN